MSGMVFRERRRQKGADLNVTSLIDVLFLLLIFFMLTSTFKRAGELDLNLPESSTAGPAGRDSRSEAVDLVLTEQGTLMLDGSPTTFDALPRELRSLNTRRPKAQVTIQAEIGVHHGQVVRMLDAVRTAGFRAVGIGTLMPKGAQTGTGR